MAAWGGKVVPGLLRFTYLRLVAQNPQMCTRSPAPLVRCRRPQACRPLCTKTTPPPEKPPKKQPKKIFATGELSPECSLVDITFTDRDGDSYTVQGKVGDSLLEVAKEYDIDLEGACEGTLSCSTCHLIVDPDWYDKIPDFLSDEEQDMLDLAYGLTDTSRLGCQILVSEALEGIKLKVPAITKDIRGT